MLQVETIRGHQAKQQKELQSDVNRNISERIKFLGKKIDGDLEKTKADVDEELKEWKVQLNDRLQHIEMLQTDANGIVNEQMEKMNKVNDNQTMLITNTTIKLENKSEIITLLEEQIGKHDRLIERSDQTAKLNSLLARIKEIDEQIRKQTASLISTQKQQEGAI